MRNTRRFTLFLLIVSVVLSMSVLHVFADGEDTAAPAETVELTMWFWGADDAQQAALAKALVETYGITEERALTGVKNFLEPLYPTGVILK